MFGMVRDGEEQEEKTRKDRSRSCDEVPYSFVYLAYVALLLT